MIYGHHERTRFTTTVERDAAVLANNADDAITGGRRDAVTEVVNDYSHATGAQVLIVDAAGEPLASLAAGPHLMRPELAAALDNRRAIGWRSRSIGVRQLYVAVPTHPATRRQGHCRASRCEPAGMPTARVP